MKFFHADMSLLIDEMGQFSTWFHDLIKKKKEDIDSTNLGSQRDKEELPDYVCTIKDAIELTKILLYMHRWMDLGSQANTPPGIKGKKKICWVEFVCEIIIFRIVCPCVRYAVIELTQVFDSLRLESTCKLSSTSIGYYFQGSNLEVGDQVIQKFVWC